MLNCAKWRTVSRRCAMIGILAIFSGLMSRYPDVDLWFSTGFYDPATGLFLLQTNPLVRVFLDVLQMVGRYFPLVCALVIVAARLNRRFTLSVSKLRVLCYVLLASVLVPGIGVNLLKSYYGRPRPVQVVQFGGQSVFAPALTVSGACSKNCSFVSGDAAVAFVPLALALLARRRRQLCIIAAFAFGVTVASMKVMQGRHFFSDVIVAALLTASVNYELYLAFFGPPQRSVS